MIRGFRLILAALALLAVAAPGAHAQYYYPYGAGWAGGGFGGFGGTIDGELARGLGAFAAGEGTYNIDTAQANAINANTLMGINQYLYLSSLEAGARERALIARRKALVDKSQTNIQQLAEQIRTNPTEADVESGAALNAILDQLSHPSIMTGSSLRMANAKIDAKLIRKIPFRDYTDAITIALDQLTDEKSWPLPLRDPAFDAERKAYIKAVDDALEQDKEGDLTEASIRKVRATIADLSKRVTEVIPPSRKAEHLEATHYIKGLAGFSRMLEKANVEQVLAELEKLETTSAGNLIAFMHSYNLRFAPAGTPGQKDAYRQLFPIMVATRDKLIGRPGEASAPGNVQPVPPTAYFQGIDEKHLHATPAPPPPR
jgi:hypothetical protein